jgi:hypothetical protein
MDDIMVATEDIDQHGKLSDKVFLLLLSNNLRGKIDKCDLFREELSFLGLHLKNGELLLDIKNQN